MPSASQRLIASEPTSRATVTHSARWRSAESPDALVGAAQAAEPVFVLAEQVRVDGADRDPLRLGEACELPVVVDAIPWNVDRDARTACRKPVDEGGVGDPLS